MGIDCKLHAKAERAILVNVRSARLRLSGRVNTKISRSGFGNSDNPHRFKYLYLCYNVPKAGVPKLIR